MGHLGHGHRPPGQPPCCPGRPLPDQPPPAPPVPDQPPPGQPPSSASQPPGPALAGPATQPARQPAVVVAPARPQLGDRGLTARNGGPGTGVAGPVPAALLAGGLGERAPDRGAQGAPGRESDHCRTGGAGFRNGHPCGVGRPLSRGCRFRGCRFRGSGFGGSGFGGAARGAGAAGDAGEWAGPGGVAARWAPVGAAAAGGLADPSPLDWTDAGSAAAQGTRPHCFGGPGELSCRARAKPPPATTAMVAVMPAAATQRCRARLSASRGGPAGGWPGPLATGAHRLTPGMRMRDRPTRDMAVSPILVRPLTNPSRRGQFSNVTGIFDDKHTGMATGTLTLETITQEERNGDWRRPRDANPRRAAPAHAAGPRTTARASPRSGRPA